MRATSNAARRQLSIGAAYGYHSRAQFSGGTRGGAFGDGGTANYKLATADMMFKTMGLTLIGAVAWREGNRAVGTIPDPTSGMVEEEAPSNGWGFFAQAGYLIPTTGFDIAARYSQVRGISDETKATTLADENEVGFGAGYFFAQHLLKLQADAFRIWESRLGFPMGLTRSGSSCKCRSEVSAHVSNAWELTLLGVSRVARPRHAIVTQPSNTARS
ncbi:MAG: hypothetical protein R3B07_22760 [Polyangiaceae bacterium]